MKNRIFLINIFWFVFNCSFASDMYENNNDGVPSFSNTPTKNSQKLNLGNINVINEPSSPSKITINNNLNIPNQTNNNQLENSYYSGECSQYYDNDYSSYSYIPYMCEYFFRRHDQHRLANATRTKWYNMDREANHYTQQHMNFNRSMPIASSMGMGMRMGGGRR